MSEDLPMPTSDRVLLALLAGRGIAPRWAASDNPIAQVHDECGRLARDVSFVGAWYTYLHRNPALAPAFQTMLEQVAFAAATRREGASPSEQISMRRRWYVGRWMPCFMLVNGSLGRLLTHPSSPLVTRGKTDVPTPLLTDVSEAVGNRRFRALRSGFSQWSFDWLEGSVEGIRVLDRDSGRETLRLTVFECEALHLLTMSTVRSIHEVLLAGMDSQDGWISK